MIKKDKYPLKLALVSFNISFGKEFKEVRVRETEKFYVVDKDGAYEAKYRKLDKVEPDGRLSREEIGHSKVGKFSLITEYLYPMDSKIVTAIQDESKRKNLVKQVGISVKELLKNPDDPRIDEIAKLLGLEVG